ncbi:unnamed protein product [Adineta ricciae]|uniref:Uncharacterized protein n=1 Tax=Adineta ricciae TaxID=249248 RepID=A0A814AQ31_ADIRI|nr:unnamed protein product [Adineta ricciae]CAF1005651.1 unnamed protein product [Adineta ricciae]
MTKIMRYVPDDFFAELYLFSSDDSAQLLIHGLPLNSTPSEGFVTFSDGNSRYLSLLMNLLDSVHQFSTRPVIAYGIDIDLEFDSKRYPRLIQRRLNRSDCGPSIYFCKIHAIIESKLDYGIHLEADSVVNWHIDVLFDVVHRWPYPLPLAPRHPDDPENYYMFFRKHRISRRRRLTPYIHAQFSWNYRAYPFFRHALKLMREGDFMAANFDETGINILLWKAKANHTFCKIDPFFTYLPAYERNQLTCDKYCHTAFIFVHGSKVYSEMHDVFQRLITHAGSPYIQTPSHGFHYLNETQFTCCEPDSQPSSIHPLLCEYRK